MESKRLMRGRHPKKNKKPAEDGKPEVFVLPPDILKKLGISLGNVSNTQDTTPDVDEGDQIGKEQKRNTKLDKKSQSIGDESILETASLMKKSVFLSPTFVSTVANVIPGEMEIASVVPSDMSTDFEKINNNTFPSDNIEITNLCISKPIATIESFSSTNLIVNGIPKASVKVDQNYSIQLQDFIPDSKSIDVSSVITVPNINAGPEEDIHTNNYSNNNLECIHEPIAITLSQPEKKNNKINIISEEIIPASKFKELKIQHVPTLTPVTIDTKIGVKMNADNHISKVSQDGLNLKSDKEIGEDMHRLSDQQNPKERRIRIYSENQNNNLGDFPKEMTKSSTLDSHNHCPVASDYNINHINECHIACNSPIQNTLNATLELPSDLQRVKHNEDNHVNHIEFNLSDISAVTGDSFRSEFACKSNVTEKNLQSIAGETIEEDNDFIIPNVTASKCDVSLLATNSLEAIHHKYIQNKLNINHENLNETHQNHSHYPVEDIELNLDRKSAECSKDMSQSDNIIICATNSLEDNDPADMEISDNDDSINEILHSETKIKYGESLFDDITLYDVKNETNIHMNGSVHNEDNSNNFVENKNNNFSKAEKEELCEVSTHKENGYTSSANCEYVKNQKEPETVGYGLNNKHILKKLNGEVLQDCNTNINSKMKDDIININNSSNTDSANEIAALLKTLSNRYSDKKSLDMRNFARDFQKKESVEMISNTIKSKLCIQGVEKPGGIDMASKTDQKVLKTYERHNRLKKSNFPIQLPTKQVECGITDVYTDTINIVVRPSDKKAQEFCLCNDFGRLDYYDSANLYEHIHFCHNRKPNCNAEIIFNIYNDDVINNRKEIDDTFIIDLEAVEKDTEGNEFKICWSDIEHESCTALEILDTNDKPTVILIDNENKNGKLDLIIRDHIASTSKADINNCDKSNPLKRNIDCASNAIIKNPDVINTENDCDDIIMNVSKDTEHPALSKDNQSSNAITPKKCDVDSISNIEHLNSDVINPEQDKESAVNMDILNRHNFVIPKKDIVALASGTEPKDSDAINFRTSDANSVVNMNFLNLQTEVVKTENPEIDNISAVIENVWNKVLIKPKKDCIPDSNIGSSVVTNPEKKNVHKPRQLEVGINRVLDTDSLKLLKPAATLPHTYKGKRQVKKEEKPQARKEDLGQGSVVISEPTEIKEEYLSDLKKKNVIPRPKENESFLYQKTSKKRKHCESVLNTSESVDDVIEAEPKNKIKCAVCHKLLSSERKWENHVIGQHQFIAWKVGDTFDIDNADLHKKLRESCKIAGHLKCTFCNTEIKQFVKFIAHVKKCMELIKNNSEDIEEGTSDSPTSKLVKCAVCEEKVEISVWFEHIGKNHNYLAWIDGEKPLNLDDEEEVRFHLLQIIRKNGDLRCYKCGLSRKRAKLYLSHVETCDGESEDEGLALSTLLEDRKSMKCGVCQEEVAIIKWSDHIATNHNYLAWEDGTPPLNLEDEEAVREHLYRYLKQDGGLTCYKCGVVRKRVKLYQTHVEKCEGLQAHLNDTSVSMKSDFDNSIKVEGGKSERICGVCKQVVPNPEWYGHIGKEHDYMAWEDGSPPIDVTDSESVRSHLYKIAKYNGGLTCSKCGLIRKYTKSYMEHIKECTGQPLETSLEIKTDIINHYHNEIASVLDNADITTVVCGVCKMEVEKDQWWNHTGMTHHYLAWMDGQTPFDVNDECEVNNYMFGIMKLVDGFICDKCGLSRKYVKSYLNHINICDGTNVTSTISTFQSRIGKEDMVECAMCNKQMLGKEWRDHAMEEHYNVAWIVGDPGFDLNSPYTVEVYIKEYQNRFNKLVCKICGASRVSRVGFYAHILTCGKTEEEMDQFKETCEKCNNKYLRIYKSQHMTAHKESELTKERKLIAASERKQKEEEPVELLSGRRKAAEKAKTVIEKYTSNVDQGCHRCRTCGYATEIEKELSDHVCVEIESNEAGDSDQSVDLNEWSEVESVDTEIDSNLSGEEQMSEEMDFKKKRHSDQSISSKVQRTPFPITNPRSYLKQCGRDYIEMYWSKETLFKQWLSCEYEAVSEEDVPKYMPPIAVSCHIRLAENDGEWMTYNRFEARKEKCVCAFVGACIQCIAWAPAKHVDCMGIEDDRTGNGSERATADCDKNFMAVACHLADDTPRSNWDHTTSGYGLIQIWDYGNMRITPEVGLCIALDYGTVWAIDWCPSGARDVSYKQDIKVSRLGLLAAACSNGSAYIFSIPYPSTMKVTNKLFYKLKPVVELRIAMGTERKLYQATSVKWSPQKGHEHIVVGYSDGTTAHFDLNCESPILRATENDVTIFYPYHDDRTLNACIEGVDMYPLADGSDAVSSGSVAGGAARRRADVTPAYTHVAVARPMFLPHWPSVMFSGDEAMLNTSVNELEWWGGGRRLGGSRASCGCLRCGSVVTAGGQLLRMTRVQPIYPELTKLVVGIIEMTPLLKKKRKLQNDDLAMVVEPTTYEDTIKKYGLEYRLVYSKDRVSQQKVTSVQRNPYPERFPLSDVKSLAFCPTQQDHEKLAVGVHAGFVIVMHL